jgi:hypothetical protein
MAINNIFSDPYIFVDTMDVFRHLLLGLEGEMFLKLDTHVMKEHVAGQ